MASPMYQVVIIGSGAGGAPIANLLAKSPKNISVLVLEKGPLLRPQTDTAPSDFKRDELFATGPEKRIALPGVRNRGESYYSSHVEPDLNDEPHIYRDNTPGREGDWATIEGYTAQVVGGGTQLYGAVSLRFPASDFRLGTVNKDRDDLKNDPTGDVKQEARDWPISYDDLEPFYCMAEELVGLNGSATNQAKRFSRDSYQAPLPINPISQFAQDGMDALGMPRYRTPLAVITQDHAASGRKAGDPKTGYVNRYGDPMGYKSNTYVSLLKPVLSTRPNIELRCNCTVTHLEDDGKGRVRRVWYRDEAGQPQSVEAKVVIVACSAIESVRLLLLSGESSPSFKDRMHAPTKSGGRKDLLGRYFLTHCFGGAETVVPARFDKSLTLDSDWATDFCATEDFIHARGLWAGGAIYNNTSAHALPISLARTYGNQDIDTIWYAFNRDTRLTGDGLVAHFDRAFGTQLSVSFMANQVPLPTNRIELHPTITDKWGRRAAYVIKDWHVHDRYLMDTLAEQCGKILAYGLDAKNPDITRIDGYGGVYRAENGVARIANHILGGARFGHDRDDSVLDANCRVWDFENLYVTDGSFMPTSGSGNPTLTIQANAFRVGTYLETLF